MNRISVAASFLFALVLAGCGQPPTTVPDDTKSGVKKIDPWEAVNARLRKETDLAAVKAALNQLNNDLSDRSDIGTQPLSEDAAKSLAALVPLSTDDLAEIRPAAYSSLDPAYIVDCFFLRDAARSLDPSGLPPGDLALIGFRWVCRQLYLQPWIIEGAGQVAAIPATYSLRRGSGSGLDRAYVFLSLLQQMGFDGCLIGPPGASEEPSFSLTLKKDGKPNALQKGPFWAVGVRVGPDVLLFEPWRGEPFPGPGGKGIGTLAQVKANPNQLKEWFEDKKTPWGVTDDDVKNATVVLALPLSSLSPRIALLEKKIKAESSVVLGMDPASLRARFTASAPNGPGLADVRFWNPPGDQFTYCRSLQGFLPTEEGGLDRADPANRLYNRYFLSMVPAAILSLPKDKELKPQVTMRLNEAILGLYGSSFFDSPSPRERIQRGQFQDAARDLTRKLRSFGLGLERVRQIDPAEVAEWCEGVNAAYENLNRKRYPNIGQTTPQPDSDPDVANAKNAIEEYWRNRDAVPKLLVDRSTAAIGRSEAAYLLALAKHEEAERRQVRSERPGSGDTATDAWREAVNAWDSFLEQNGATSVTLRTDHAKWLAARARTLVGK